MLRSPLAVDLFFISLLVLFLELACIRWFPAHVAALSFFTNTVLLASFVGMSIGCLLARRAVRHIAYTPFFLVLALFAGYLVNFYSYFFLGRTDVGNQSNPDVIFFGTEGLRSDIEFKIHIELFGTVFFFLVAACLVGPGQELGRAFNRITNRTTAYTLDLCGSLLGIVIFGICSYFQLPPLAWFSILSVGLLYFLRKPETEEGGITSPLVKKLGLLALAVPPLLVFQTSFTLNPHPDAPKVQWSPYYKIDYTPIDQAIATNGTGHQMMIPLGVPTQSPYDLPYLFQREIGRPEYKRILVIGAGSGNDLSRALYWCGPETKIDAVDIDPVIQSLGAKYHPEKPYSDPRVTRHLNDGRNFLRNAPSGTYDLIVFALVDSLVLHSGQSGGVRLESYLFTKESFEDAQRALKPDGTMTVYNFFRQGWVVARLREVMREVFGADPVVLLDPPYKQAAVLPRNHNFGSSGIGFLFAGAPAAIDPLRAKFSNGNAFWVPGKAGMTKELPGRFAAEAPTQMYKGNTDVADADESNRPRWVALRPTLVEESDGTLKTATDDWPFLYVREPNIPALTWRTIGLTVILSGLLWLTFSLWGKTRTEDKPTYSLPVEYGLLARSFLLGAGFMLIETKAVVQMALLFGSTWIVNTFVFGAILVSAMLGNLYAGWVKPKRLEPYYLGLILAIGLNLAVPLKVFLGWEPILQAVASCALVFAPVLFAGVIFPTSFARSSRPDWFFGANVAGALVGGLAENFSMLLGFRMLMIVALVFYGGSALFGSGRTTTNKPVE